MRKIVSSVLIAGILSVISFPLYHPSAQTNMPSYQVKTNGPQDANELDQIRIVLNEIGGTSIKKRKQKEEVG
jgi:hypothetical protein